jgi:ABC-type branched-subunit amino acid transport system ATPase component
VPILDEHVISKEARVSIILEARDVDAGYGDMAVVRKLNLHVAEGEAVALFGANGAGKTTTIHTLFGDLAVLGGHVRLDDQVVRGPVHHRVTAGMGVVTEARSVLMQLTVDENLKLARGSVRRALDLFPELTEHLGRRVGLLSGGQQQMLALARALSREPRILLIDELSLGLAPLIVDRLLAAVRAAADQGTGVLLVEQHIHKALAVADRVYVMRRGEIVLDVGADEARGNVEKIRSSYLAHDDQHAGAPA